ncbi:hypothetical protein [Dyella monticola]|uniref:hypothetical protein n=1 Tax=Dyella monticola TaxID=1927958 RepID=UPI001313E41F|nr:hypothetical protein [Dyella monticola]
MHKVLAGNPWTVPLDPLMRRTRRMQCDMQHITSLALLGMQNQTCVTTMASIWLPNCRPFLRQGMALSIRQRRIRRKGKKRFQRDWRTHHEQPVPTHYAFLVV